MTCTHVLGLIDAGPFADYPRAHLDAARTHARTCPTCGPAWEAAIALTSDLAALPRPAAPPDLAAIVQARIAQIDQAGARADAAERTVSARLGALDWSPLAMAIGGGAAGLAVVVSTMGDGLPPAAGWTGTVGLTTVLGTMASSTTGAAILVTSLVLYVVGLFRPVSS